MPAHPQQVVQLVGVPRCRLQRPLDLLDRVAVEQLAQLLLAEQLAQQVAVERERLRAALRRRRVVLVHVGRDVVEEERGREGRGRDGLDLDEIELARLQAVEDPAQRGQVEDVLQALAIGLEHDRERAVLARDLEEALRLQALLPERRALARPAARDQERARGVLAEAGAEERRLAHLLHDELLDLVRADEQVGHGRRRVRVGEMERDAVVRPDRLHLDPEAVPQPRGERHRPRRVHAAAERRQDADAPVADLVAEALDDDRAVGRHDARRRLLLAEEDEEVASPRARRGGSRSAARRPPSRRRARRACATRAPIFSPSSYGRPTPSPFQNGTAPGTPGARRDEHPVARDLLDPPGRGAEQEGLALPSLVDHLLVELADAAAAVDEVDAEEASVRDRAGVRDRKPAGALAPANHARSPIPDDARSQLGELVRGVAAGEHVEHVLELLARERRERVGAADEPVQRRDLDLLVGHDRDDLLGEHVERVARDRRLLDRAVAHRARDDSALEQIGAELREDAALRDGAELVAGAADPLQPARDRLRALDLDDEVDGAHVDAELEAEVATRHGISPAFRSSSISTRCSRAREPWCARAISASASSFSRSASRSAVRRLLTKTIVERCSRTSASSSG